MSVNGFMLLRIIISALKHDLIDDHGHGPSVTEPIIAVMVLISLTTIQSMHRHVHPVETTNDALTSPHSIHLDPTWTLLFATVQSKVPQHLLPWEL
jgi:hypothetical protein